MRRVIALHLYDIDRLRVARGRFGQQFAWVPYPWFSDVQGLVVLGDGSPLVAGAAGLTQLTPDLQRCVWRDDGEAIADVDVGPRGLLGAGERLCLWSRPGGDPVRWEPESLGLYAPPVCVRWHPDQRSAAVADALGRIVLVIVERGEARLRECSGRSRRRPVWPGIRAGAARHWRSPA